MTITWKRTANALLVTLLAVLLLGRLAGTARADVFDVSTPQELQSAISAAAGTVGDDTINLAAGTYDIGSTIGVVNLRAFDESDGSSNGITLSATYGVSLHAPVLVSTMKIWPFAYSTYATSLRSTAIENGCEPFAGHTSCAIFVNVAVGGSKRRSQSSVATA